MHVKIDQSTAAELSVLGEKLIYLNQMAREKTHFFFEPPERPELVQARSRRAYLVTLVEWYTEKIQEIFALISPIEFTIGGDERFYENDKVYRTNTIQQAEQMLNDMLRRSTIESVLPGFVAQLVRYKWLSPEAAAALDLTAPVDVERAKRLKEEEERERTWKENIEKLRQAVLSYGKGDLRDFLETYNSRRGWNEHSEKDLLEFARELGRRELLPGGDRMLYSAKELWAKLKGILE